MNSSTAMEKQGTVALDKTLPEWKRVMAQLIVVYRILECGDKIPLDTDGTIYEFANDLLDGMHTAELIGISEDSTHWVVTPKGHKLRESCAAVYDHCLKFEIFGDVAVYLEVDEDILDENGNVGKAHYDPRFGPFEDGFDEKENGVADLRIAMIRYMSELTAEENKEAKPIDPRIFVIVQLIADGKIKEDDDLWFHLKLGSLYDGVDEIINEAVTLEDLSDDPEEAASMLESIYTAGMLEQRRRDGQECANCGTPLALFEHDPAEDPKATRRELTSCPVCEASYEPPESEDGWECPACRTSLSGSESFCGGCGARVDKSLPSGTIRETEEVVEETTTTTETEEDDFMCGYGCGYGWYNPYSPIVDTLVFCAAVDMMYGCCW